MNEPDCLTNLRRHHFMYPNDRVCLTDGEITQLLDFIHYVSIHPARGYPAGKEFVVLSGEGLPLDHGAIDRINGFGG